MKSREQRQEWNCCLTGIISLLRFMDAFILKWHKQTSFMSSFYSSVMWSILTSFSGLRCFCLKNKNWLQSVFNLITDPILSYSLILSRSLNSRASPTLHMQSSMSALRRCLHECIKDFPCGFIPFLFSDGNVIVWTDHRSANAITALCCSYFLTLFCVWINCLNWPLSKARSWILTCKMTKSPVVLILTTVWKVPLVVNPQTIFTWIWSSLEHFSVFQLTVTALIWKALTKHLHVYLPSSKQQPLLPASNSVEHLADSGLVSSWYYFAESSD